MSKTIFDPIANKSGFVTVELDVEELLAMTRLMSFSKDAFVYMSQQATTEGNAEEAAKHAGNARVAEILYTKLSSLAKIGQPESTNFH